MSEKRHLVAFAGLLLLSGIWMGVIGCRNGPVLFLSETSSEDHFDAEETDDERARDTVTDSTWDSSGAFDSATNTEQSSSNDTATETGNIDTVIGDGTEGACDDDALLIPLNADGGTVCTGTLAERFFRFGLCTCRDANVTGDLHTDSFDSSLSPVDSFDDYGGAVGVNGELRVAGDIVIGGTAVFGNEGGVTFLGETEIHGDLKVGGTLSFGRALSVTRDAQIEGSIISSGPLDIGRDLYLSGEILSINSVTIGGEQIAASDMVKPPCPCEPDEILDVAAIVDAAREDNQNLEIGLDADALSFVMGTVSLHLGCGRYYLDHMGGIGKVTLHVNGPTALFIGGDFDLIGDLDLVLEQNGTIDIFIAGNLELAGINDALDITRPSAVRFYVGGENEVILSNVTGFNLYAPRALVELSTNNFGSIFAGVFTSITDTRIHYDRDIVRAGQHCDDDSISDEACVPSDGACETDNDCCEPLICIKETCRPFMPII